MAFIWPLNQNPSNTQYLPLDQQAIIDVIIWFKHLFTDPQNPRIDSVSCEDAQMDFEHPQLNVHDFVQNSLKL